MSKQDFLNEDPVLSGQKYVCLSFLTPTKEDQSSITGIKVRGVYEDYNEACKRAKELQEMDPAFGVFVGEVGKWLPFDPEPDSDLVKSSEYANEELNEIMKNYLINQEKSRIFHEKRKNEMTRKNLEENITKSKEQLKNAEKEHRKASTDSKKTFELRMKNLEDRIKEMESKAENLLKQEKQYDEEMENINKNKSEPKLPEPPRNVTLE
jgi:hypothetical protein